MKNLLFHPVHFFKSLASDPPSIWLPGIIIITTGILNGMSSIINAGGSTITDLFNGKFPIVKFIYLSIILILLFIL